MIMKQTALLTACKNLETLLEKHAKFRLFINTCDERYFRCTLVLVEEEVEIFRTFSKAVAKAEKD